MKIKVSNIKKYFISFVFFILLWQLFIYLSNLLLPAGQTSIEAFIPSPATILETLIKRMDVLMVELFYTFSKAFLGLLLGLSIAFFLEYVFFIKPKTRSLLLPFLIAVNSFPTIGFSPVIILMFGQGSWLGIVFISMLVSYFPILISIDKAVTMNSKVYTDLGKVWGFSRTKIFSKIQLPLAVPYLIASLKMAIPTSIIGAILGEWLGTNHGIGRIIVVALYQLNPGLTYSALLLVCLFTFLLTRFIDYMCHRFFPWTENNDNN